jgi:hypothetical protein
LKKLRFYIWQIPGWATVWAIFFQKASGHPDPTTITSCKAGAVKKLASQQIANKKITNKNNNKLPTKKIAELRFCWAKLNRRMHLSTSTPPPKKAGIIYCYNLPSLSQLTYKLQVHVNVQYTYKLNLCMYKFNLQVQLTSSTYKFNLQVQLTSSTYKFNLQVQFEDAHK